MTDTPDDFELDPADEPQAATAGQEDHSDPTAFTGDPVDDDPTEEDA